MIRLSGAVLETLHRLGKIVPPVKTHGPLAASQRPRLQYLHQGVLEFSASDGHVALSSRFAVAQDAADWDVTLSAEKWKQTSGLIPRATHKAEVEDGVLTLRTNQHTLRYRTLSGADSLHLPSLEEVTSSREFNVAGLHDALDWISQSKQSRLKPGCRVNQCCLFQNGLAYRTSTDMQWSLQSSLDLATNLYLEPHDAGRVVNWLDAVRDTIPVPTEVSVRLGVLHGRRWYELSASNGLHRLWMEASREPLNVNYIRAFQNAERRSSRNVHHRDLRSAIRDIAGFGHEIQLSVSDEARSSLLILRTNSGEDEATATLETISAAEQQPMGQFPTVRVSSRSLLTAITNWPEDAPVVVAVYAGPFPLRLQSADTADRNCIGYREILLGGSIRSSSTE